MTDVVSRLWGFATRCATTASTTATTSSRSPTCCSSRWPTSRTSSCPKETDWQHLRAAERHRTRRAYEDALRTLGKQPGILGDIFAGSQNRFSNPATLAQLIKSIDETEWTSLEVDVKAAAFEGLLEKAAAEGKKGAGQYFTPRPLIQSMVRLHAARPARQASSSPSATRPAAPAASSSPPTNGSRSRPAGALRPRYRQADPNLHLLRPGARRAAAPAGADEPLPAPGRAAHHARRLDLRGRRPSSASTSS